MTVMSPQLKTKTKLYQLLFHSVLLPSSACVNTSSTFFDGVVSQNVKNETFLVHLVPFKGNGSIERLVDNSSSFLPPA